MDFIEYLSKIHAKNYHGLDDDMPDDFDKWMNDLDPWEIVNYADEWGKTLIKGGENK